MALNRSFKLTNPPMWVNKNISAKKSGQTSALDSNPMLLGKTHKRIELQFLLPRVAKPVIRLGHECRVR